VTTDPRHPDDGLSSSNLRASTGQCTRRPDRADRQKTATTTQLRRAVPIDTRPPGIRVEAIESVLRDAIFTQE